MRMRTALSLFLTFIALSSLAGERLLEIDASKPAGAIRPLHGGNCGPLQFGGLIDLTRHFKDAAFPILRLHDCHWPIPDVVDIHVLFPNPNADPEKPESYDFRRTDDYVKATLATGAQIVFRLGESIEHQAPRRFVHPPKDPAKWAAICIQIIRHYNEGWASGFKHNIKYWEIWNEPENRPSMWSGTDEDYFNLYEVASKAIKARFPDVKVGGPALGYTGSLTQGVYKPGDFLTAFLDRCRARSLPLDFFSWHLYTNQPSEVTARSRGIRQALDQRGFEKTESHLNEWNYLPDNDWSSMSLKNQGELRERFDRRAGGAEGAAFVAAMLIQMQDSPIDVANFYLNDSGPLFCLFSVHGVPRKPFFAMKTFRELLRTPNRLPATGSAPDMLSVCAGISDDKSAIGILVSNRSATDRPLRLAIRNLPWSGATKFTLSVVDETKNLRVVRSGEWPAEPFDLAADLPPPAVGFLTLAPIAK